jgi:hypothetical protein
MLDFSVGKPPGDRPSIHEEMQQAILDSGALLADRWSRRRRDDDVLVFGDLSRPDFLEMAREQLERTEIDRILRESGSSNIRPMAACLQPARFIDMLARDGSHAHRAAAQELRGFARRGNALPLLVLTPGGIWATCWSPDPKVLIHRYEPETTPEAN